MDINHKLSLRNDLRHELSLMNHASSNLLLCECTFHKSIQVESLSKGAYFLLEAEIVMV